MTLALPALRWTASRAERVACAGGGAGVAGYHLHGRCHQSVACLHQRPSFRGEPGNSPRARGFPRTTLEADVTPIDIDPGMRVRLSELGRRKSKMPDKQGVVIAASRSGTAFRVQWEQQKTADFVHFTLLQACDERRA